jgi:hypothetical protein
MTRRIAVALLLCSCAAELTAAELEEATARTCETVVSGTIEERENALLAHIEATGRRIHVRKHGIGYTVLPRQMLQPPNYHERTHGSRVASLQHEAVHVCRSGDKRIAWTVRYAVDADRRLLEEVAGLVAQAAEVYRQGRDGEALIRDRVSKMPARYHIELDAEWAERVLIPAVVLAAKGAR